MSSSARESVDASGLQFGYSRHIIAGRGSLAAIRLDVRKDYADTSIYCLGGGHGQHPAPIAIEQGQGIADAAVQLNQLGGHLERHAKGRGCFQCRVAPHGEGQLVLLGCG